MTGGLLLERLDRWVRRGAPFVTTVLLVAIGAIQMPIPDYRIIAPLLPLMAVFYWALFRPDLMPAGAVFVIGALEDVFTGAPLGVNALLFLLVHGLVRWQRRLLAGRGFPHVWAALAVVMLVAGAVAFLAAAVLSGAALRPEPAFVQILLSLALFPCLAWVLVRVQRAFLARA